MWPLKPNSSMQTLPHVKKINSLALTVTPFILIWHPRPTVDIDTSTQVWYELPVRLLSKGLCLYQSAIICCHEISYHNKVHLWTNRPYWWCYKHVQSEKCMGPSSNPISKALVSRWCVWFSLYHIYQVGLKVSFDDVISAVADFLYQWDPSTATHLEDVCRLQRNDAEKQTLFGHIPWEYLGQLRNFSVDPRIYIYIYIYIYILIIRVLNVGDRAYVDLRIE